MRNFKAFQSMAILLVFHASAQLMTPSAWAGGWSSGGGELLKDAVNPWFLNNTPQVTYCIVIDKKNFGASEETVRQHLNRALHFWKQQFSHAVLPNSSKLGLLKIASQEFVETACNKDPNISFQFGVLSQKQKEFLRNPADYAAITVRTEYDQRNLRAKGFVYISPSSGALAYDSEGVVKNAWSINGGHLLYLTLVHELGHVFGLPHMGSYGDIMAEGFVESILAGAAQATTSHSGDLNFFSLPKGGRLLCPAAVVAERWQNFFGADLADRCFQFKFKHDSKNELFGKTWLAVSVSGSNTEVPKTIYEIELTMDRFFPSFTSIIWLSKYQAVFDSSDFFPGITSGIPGISGLSIGKQGTFVTVKDETQRSIIVRFEQGSARVSIDGVLDGKLVPIL